MREEWFDARPAGKARRSATAGAWSYNPGYSRAAAIVDMGFIIVFRWTIVNMDIVGRRTFQGIVYAEFHPSASAQ